MIDVKTEKKLVEQEVIVSGHCECDICGKVIYNYLGRNHSRHDEYWTLRTGHYDRGNDSCESARSFDLCSKECCIKALEKYLDEYSGRRNTGYFELRHENSES